jgi:hypothetical protein
MTCTVDCGEDNYWTESPLRPVWNLLAVGDERLSDCTRTYWRFLSTIRKIEHVVQPLSAETLSVRQAIRTFVQKTAEMPQLSLLTVRASVYGPFGDPEVLSYLFLAS